MLSTGPPQQAAECTSVFCVDVFRGNSACVLGNVPLSLGRIESLPNQTFLFQLTGDPCPKGLELNLSRTDNKPAQTTKDYINVHVAVERAESWHRASLRLPVSSPKKARQPCAQGVPAYSVLF